MRQTIHRTTIVGHCPHGGVDIYEAEFHVLDRFVSVEDIQTAIDDLTAASPIYQETLTHSLAYRINCKVITRGTHGRFSTECQVEPDKEMADALACIRSNVGGAEVLPSTP